MFRSRWVRLLFSREFPFDKVLVMWDTMFSIDPKFELMDLICTAMLVRIRWDCEYFVYPRINLILAY